MKPFLISTGVTMVIASVAAVAATAAGQSEAWAAESTSLPCRSPGRIVAATHTSLLTQEPGSGLYACTKGHRARFVSVSPDDDQYNSGAKLLQLTSRYAAVAADSCGKESCRAGIILLDLATNRKARATVQNAVGSTFGSLVLTAKGTAAWTIQTPTGVEVRRMSAKSPDTLLDTGAVDPGSLALTGTRIYWLNAGQPKSSVLP